ncbi:hypothetical protein F5878DRAFT_666726 [Lentinula raphanica]|uniref:Uncharacterized protein n=1 Tax=Lentinula raphanica TaxID=153919 RepID=A0AA38NX58_9AGAR|nr:hypothetical protein F5878DRAFT_666726 [Lentinula raphanica]
MTRLKTSKKGEALERFLSECRSQGLSRRKWRYRVKARNARKLTNAEKQARRKKRLNKKASYNEKIAEIQAMIVREAEELRATLGKYSVKQILDDIYQSHRLKRRVKNSGRFNAFASLSLAKINAEVPPGAPREKLTAHMGDIAKEWGAMSKDEQIEATRDHLETLHQNRMNREAGHHNAALAAYHDTRLTFDDCQDALTRLGMRTGDQSILITVRSDSGHFNQPRVFVSSDRVTEFFALAFKLGPDELSKRMEGYMLSGIEGVVRTHAQQLCLEKSKLSNLILEKLQHCAGKAKVTRMAYTNFAEHITASHGVILKNWPPGIKFVSPSNLTTASDVRLLTTSFENNVTHFYKMTSAEFAEWKRNPNRLVDVSQPATPSNAADDAASDTDSQNTTADGPSQHDSSGSEQVGVTESNVASPNVPSPTAAPSVVGSSAPAASFVNSFAVTTADGSGVQYVQKKRKRRSDADKPRGPRKKAAL